MPYNYGRKMLKEIKNNEKRSSYGLLVLESLRNDQAILALPAHDEQRRRGKKRVAEDTEGTEAWKENRKARVGNTSNEDEPSSNFSSKLFNQADMLFKDVRNTDSVSHVESMQRFVESAGHVAKYIADKKCNEYSRRMQARTLYKPSTFGSPSSIGTQPTYGENLNSSSVSRSGEPSRASEVFEFASCELHTDELWNQLSYIGSMASSSDQASNEWHQHGSQGAIQK